MSSNIEVVQKNMSKKLFLVSNDNYIEWLSPIFVSAGFNLTATSDNQKILKLLYENQPDFVFMVLDSKNTLEINIEYLTRRIREVSHVPIVVLSEANQPAEILKYFEAGIDDYLFAPIDEQVLL